MKNIIIKLTLPVILAFAAGADILPQDNKQPLAPVVFDGKFNSDLQNMDPIKRDVFLHKILNRIVSGRGYVESVNTDKRYNRNIRIILKNSVNNHNILFYLFSDKDEYSGLNKGDIFEFAGQFIIYTPVTTKRDLYIFDIILEDGAMVVE